MSEADIRSVVVERELPFPPEKIWRALTQPHLMAEWLMKSDFRPEVGHGFNFTADWGVLDCEVLEVEPQRTLTYTWNGLGLVSTVTWTLEPTPGGARLRMEQVGFKPDQERAYRGATSGWPRFFDSLAELLGRID
ncbi:SRPBCC domain-containing protein [Phenylobacterium sp. J426]|uniref:SRPBCC family protein n=1 Tax=Phenylobacterium sp. J426 TaxID=2898439 RepID=UPI0021517F3C|nr:SRPBCC domain-containing protein [Phenylobacterium sp. J426]MCR5874273.1 SRPBCC domain-containing protein [Phenylobacterium sp. J426]